MGAPTPLFPRKNIFLKGDVIMSLSWITANETSYFLLPTIWKVDGRLVSISICHRMRGVYKENEKKKKADPNGPAEPRVWPLPPD